MTISVGSAMRAGLVSGKAAAKWKKPSILNQTTSQRGKMAAFDGKQKDDGAVKNKGVDGKDHINASQFQKDRVSSMPSKAKGGGGYAALTRGSKSPQGGGVGSSYVPGKYQIDQFPQKQASTFPKGAGYEGRGRSDKTGNTRMKGKQPVKSGGPSGGNANNKSYYGGPKGRDGT